MELTEIFQKIIDRQRKIGYGFPDLLNKPATTSEIEETEKQLGLKFNDELNALYLFANGENPKGLPSGKTGLIPIHDFMDLEWAVQTFDNFAELKEPHEKRMANELMDAFYVYDKEVPNYIPGPQLFPFLTDGAGNYYWVDLNEGQPTYGKIFWTNTFGESADYTFNSLTAMFQTILRCYETGIIFIDYEGHLDCDDKKWREVARSLNPGMEAYWDRYL